MPTVLESLDPEYAAWRKWLQSIQWIPARDAYRCLDCDAISNQRASCPACGSRAVIALEVLHENNCKAAPNAVQPGVVHSSSAAGDLAKKNNEEVKDGR